jgi:hypothetical protein
MELDVAIKGASFMQHAKYIDQLTEPIIVMAAAWG